MQITSEICFFSWFVLFSLQHQQQQQCLPHFYDLKQTRKKPHNATLSSQEYTQHITYMNARYTQIKLGLRVSPMTKSQPLDDQKN